MAAQAAAENSARSYCNILLSAHAKEKAHRNFKDAVDDQGALVVRNQPCRRVLCCHQKLKDACNQNGHAKADKVVSAGRDAAAEVCACISCKAHKRNMQASNAHGLPCCHLQSDAQTHVKSVEGYNNQSLYTVRY